MPDYPYRSKTRHSCVRPDKAGKNVDVWLLPILEAYIHQAWSEIAARLEWAMLYISKNAEKAQQRKTKKNRTLDGIFEMLNS